MSGRTRPTRNNIPFFPHPVRASVGRHHARPTLPANQSSGSALSTGPFYPQNEDDLALPAKHSLISTLEGPFNPQNESVLFAGIPPEIRNRIFSFALYSYDDLSRPFPENSYYTRPGYRYRQRSNTALLETCRLIYSETHDLPISQNEHVFWCSSNRGPHPSSDNTERYFARFTEEQKEAVVRVHIFTQLFWLEGDRFKRICQLKDLRLKRLKITIRHTDWWFWENNKRLEMKSSWGYHLNFIKGLETLEVELETMERDKAQLETIARNMLSWRFDISDTQSLATDGKTIQQEKYIGQSSFSDNAEFGGGLIYYNPQNNRWARVMRGRPKPVFPPQLTYVVSTLHWNMVSKSKEDS